MKEYSIQRAGRPVLPVIASNWGDARGSAEAALADEVDRPHADGFRWVKGNPGSWTYQVVSEDERVLLEAYLVEKA